MPGGWEDKVMPGRREARENLLVELIDLWEHRRGKDDTVVNSTKPP